MTTTDSRESLTVVKYFHEEPAGLEILADDVDADARNAGEPLSLEDYLVRRPYYRGYLAATVLPGLETGATVRKAVVAWLDPLIRALSKSGWWSPEGDWLPVDPVVALSDALPGQIVITADREPRVVAADTPDESTRRRFAGIRPLLDTGATVLLAEPAPGGVDWAIFSMEPLAERVRSAFEEGPATNVRRFVIPLKEARGEHRFYFERYDLELYARYEVG